MNDDLTRRILENKRTRRRELAALPVGEKLRILEEMLKQTSAIAATRPPKPAKPVRVSR